MKRKKYKVKGHDNKIQEPGTLNINSEKPGNPRRGITVTTLEEQKEAERYFYAGLTHLECLEILQKLIRISFGQQFEKPVAELWNKEIHITRSR
jgi:hypothetical protein